MEAVLKESERLDDLQRNGLFVIQNPGEYCFGVDTVLLAWFSEILPGEHVLDLCTGSGTVMFLTDARYPGASYTGVEILPEAADRALRSVRLNGLSDHMEIVCGNALSAAERFGRGAFDVVTMNPPYGKAGAGRRNPDSAKAMARHEVSCTLPELLQTASALLKPGGRLYLVHRPARLAELISCMKECRLAPEKLQFVHPFRDAEAELVLVSAVKGGRNAVKALPPVVIYREKGIYTDEYLRIYRE